MTTDRMLTGVGLIAALPVGSRMSAGGADDPALILVVSGPTVVAPLLRFIRPTERLRRVLAWGKDR